MTDPHRIAARLVDEVLAGAASGSMCPAKRAAAGAELERRRAERAARQREAFRKLGAAVAEQYLAMRQMVAWITEGFADQFAQEGHR